MKTFLRWFIALMGICCGVATVNAGDIYLGLSAQGERMELGLGGFAPASATIDESRMGRQVFDVLRNDMLFSRYFNIIEGGPLYTGDEAQLKQWEDIGANVLVTGEIRITRDSMAVTARLLDCGSRQSIWQKEYTGAFNEYRRIAHEINDELVQRFTGERGIAHTRIAFVNNASGKKEIYLADYDGYNLKPLTELRSISLMPKWAPDGKELIFTTYRYGNPDLYAIAPDGSQLHPVSRRQGLNTAGSYSPDGQQIILTLSQGRTPNLFLLSRTGQLVRQMSFVRAAATSPCFAPNGKEIVFISDSPGYPQLFVMGMEGANMRQLPVRGYCDSPAWSPRGDKIAFTMRLARDNYDIYIYDLATNDVTRLTQGEGYNENPTWSPDGRFLAFSSTRSGKSEIYIMAIDGTGVRRLGNFSGSSTAPSWSP